MFNKLGAGEIILIVGAALLIFGPAKLPELGRAIGKSIREFRGAFRETADSVKEAASSEIQSIQAAVSDTDSKKA